MDPLPSAKSRLIVTVHGIRTYGQWQERLEKLVCAGADAQDIEFVNYKYGYFSLIAFVIPFFRWLVVRRFRKTLVQLCAETPRSRIDLVGHSFGTHLIGWAVYGLSPDSTISIHTVILSGSVLRAGFPWRDLIGKRVKRVINDCGSKDGVLLLSQFAVLFTGMAGRIGFSGATSRFFRNRYSVFGHSQYFQNNRGIARDRYMRLQWLPLLQDDEPIDYFDKRGKPTAIDGIVAVLANNAEPIKLIVYVAPFVWLSWFIYGLYTNAAAERDRALIAQSRFLSQAAREHLDAGDANTAMLLTVEALPDSATGTDRPYVAEAELPLDSALRRPHERFVLWGHVGAVDFAMFSSDGRRVLTASSDAIANDGTAHVWNADTGKEITPLRGHTGNLWNAGFSRDGQRVVTVSSDGTARVWNATTGAEIFKAVFSGIGGSASISPDGRFVVTAAPPSSGDMESSEKIARVWNIDTGLQTATLQGHQAAITSVSFSSDGQLIATASWDRTARVWNAATGRPIAVLKGHRTTVDDVKFSPDGQRVVTMSLDVNNGGLDVDNPKSEVWIWNSKTGVVVHKLVGHTGEVKSAVFSHNGSLIVTASALGQRYAWASAAGGSTVATDGDARVWEVETGRQVAILLGHTGTVSNAEFSADDKSVITASSDGTIRVWDPLKGEERFRLNGHQGGVNAAAFSPDGRFAVAGSEDRTARIWDMDPEKELAILKGRRAIFSPDGRRVLAVPDDSTARICDPETGQELAILKGHTSSVIDFAFDSKGLHVVTGSYDKTARVWDSETGSQVAVLTGHGHNVVSAAFSPDGRSVVTSSVDKTAKVWDALTGRLLATLEGHEGTVGQARFSRDGLRVVTASDDHTARVWDAKSGKEIKLLKGHNSAVKTALFSPDDRLIVTASPDGTARLWNAESGELIFTLAGDDFSLDRASFSPDGRRVVAASSDKMARIWSTATGKEIIALGGRSFGLGWASFNRNGQRVITAHTDAAAIWDARSGAEIVHLSQHKGQMNSVELSPDGTRLLTATSDGTTRIWRASPTTQDLVDRARAANPRCLTPAQRSRFFLLPTPPAWCITGDGREKDDPSGWDPKWPYRTPEWIEWFGKKQRQGAPPSLPTPFNAD